MEKYYFEKKEYDDGAVHIFATAKGWTNEYTPDGDVDTSLEMTGIGEKITQAEAGEILYEYGWNICGNCGNIFPEGGDCEDCLHQKNKKEEGKMLREKMINDLREDNTIELLEEAGKINIDFIDEDLGLLIEVLEEEFYIKTEIQNLVGGQYLVYLGNLFDLDVKNDVEMEEIHDGEWLSVNGRWSVTRNGVYRNVGEGSELVGDMEDMPDAVQKVYDQLQGE